MSISTVPHLFDARLEPLEDVRDTALDEEILETAERYRGELPRPREGDDVVVTVERRPRPRPHPRWLAAVVKGLRALMLPGLPTTRDRRLDRLMRD